MNTLEEIKNRIAEFSDKVFGADRSYTAPLYHLKKEVDEAIETGEISEFADLLLLVLDSYRKKYPNYTTQDLLDSCDNKIDILYTRNYGEPDENGVVEHIRN